jgi:energy-coupling factor transport system ATP-binding protein
MANKKKIADGNAKDIFWDMQVMEQAALKQPPICALANKLGIGEFIVTEEEMLQAVLNRSC